jgi:hypothetical protein
LFVVDAIGLSQLQLIVNNSLKMQLPIDNGSNRYPIPNHFFTFFITVLALSKNNDNTDGKEKGAAFFFSLPLSKEHQRASELLPPELEQIVH